MMDAGAKYSYNIGDILQDNTFGSEWIVREKIPGGVKVQLNKEGGPFINATEDSCSFEFMLKQKARRTMNDIIAGIERAICDGETLATENKNLSRCHENHRAWEEFHSLAKILKEWHNDAKYITAYRDSVFEDESPCARSIANDIIEALAALNFEEDT